MYPVDQTIPTKRSNKYSAIREQTCIIWIDSEQPYQRLIHLAQWVSEYERKSHCSCGEGDGKAAHLDPKHVQVPACMLAWLTCMCHSSSQTSFWDHHFAVQRRSAFCNELPTHGRTAESLGLIIVIIRVSTQKKMCGMKNTGEEAHAKMVTPHSIPAMETTFSWTWMGVMSPYPTVAIVLMAQYILEICNMQQRWRQCRYGSVGPCLHHRHGNMQELTTNRKCHDVTGLWSKHWIQCSRKQT